jgi:hypothetical protein
MTPRSGLGIHRADIDVEDAVTATLAEAFHGGDLAGWLIPDPAERRFVYPEYFRMFAEWAAVRPARVQVDGPGADHRRSEPVPDVAATPPGLLTSASLAIPQRCADTRVREGGALLLRGAPPTILGKEPRAPRRLRKGRPTLGRHRRRRSACPDRYGLRRVVADKGRLVKADESHLTWPACGGSGRDSRRASGVSVTGATAGIV